MARINYAPAMASRAKAGREASLTADVIDSQSVKTTGISGPRGFDAGNAVKGSRRHIVTDSKGRLVGLQIHTADIQPRDGVGQVIASVRARCPSLRDLFRGQPHPPCRHPGGLCS